MSESKHPTQGSQLNPLHLFQNGFSVSQQRLTSASSSSSDAAKRSRRDNLNRPKPSSSSSSSRNTHSSTSTRAENRAAQREVRTLPSWIDSFEEGDDASPTDKLISSPSRAHSAQHHHTPTQPHRRVSQDGWVDIEDVDAAPKQETGFFGGHKEPVKGRKWDHVRDSVPVFMAGGDNPYIPTPPSPWGMYIKSSMYGPSQSEDAKRVDEAFLQSLTPGYEKPWRGDLEGGDAEKLAGLIHSKKKRRTLLKHVQHILLMHPFVPLIFRGTVFTTSTIALGLSGSVHALSKKYSYPQTPSTTMAIVVDVVSIPYILYITWDEYRGKPLGLRSPKAKIRLVLLDLWFIIFESANLALAFAALTDDSGSCQEGGSNGYNSIICRRVTGLCAFLFVALIAWSMTFSVSIFRLVERVGGREEAD
ncbi:Regulator of phospholipase D SRF1 [Lachnellula arida]|uniref:Regulator of phospholipase D SRF1 n=1 Tax=Lachnellula arida TaxID=1316785 RepID=A0A8T9BPG4_9HELO|nr:Regulator of phospholipase D SRF1 [Lachnellula arida]